MIYPRKLSMQLTPLLDLLLIIIFAQFIDFREKEAMVTIPSVELSMELEEALVTLREVEQRLQQAEQIGKQADMRIAKSEADAERHQRLLVNSKQDLDRTLAQQRVLGELVVELFNVPATEIAQLLDPVNHPSGLSQSDLDQLKDKFRDMALERSGAMIECWP